MGSKSSRPGNQEEALDHHPSIIGIARPCASRNREAEFSGHPGAEDSGEALLDVVGHTIDAPLDIRQQHPGASSSLFKENAVKFSEIL